MIRRDRNREILPGAVFTRRALLIGGAQTLLLGGLAARLRQVQLEEGGRYAMMAEDNRLSARMIAPARGRILDRFGAVLAGNLINWRALLVIEQTIDVARSLDNFSALVPLTDAERARIDRDLRHGKSFIPILVKEYLSRDDMTKIEVNAPDMPGILVDAGTTRTYNYPYELAHILGYVAPPNESDMDGDPLMSLPGVKVGRTGIEKFHDLALRGRPGVLHLEVNAVGRVIRELDRTDGVNGDDIGLTFDLGLQLAVQKRLGDDAASAVVLDCRNGEIMAMASNPSFDPTLFATGVSQAQWNEWTKDRRTPLINKATSGLYAPGSTFKMAVALAGLDAKAITYGDRLSCPGHLDVGNARFHCWNKSGHGLLDLHQALKYSCDVYFYQVAMRTGIDRISAMAHRLGMGVELDIDIPGQRVGLVPTREWRISKGHPWELGDTVVSGIGQGYIVVSPLQLATYAARIASGRAIQPHFTRRIAGALQPGSQPDDWPDLGVPDPCCRRYGPACSRWSTNRAALLRGRGFPVRSIWPAKPARPRCGGCRGRCARAASSTAKTCRGSSGRTRCSSLTRPMSNLSTHCPWWSSTATPVAPPPRRSRETSWPRCFASIRPAVRTTDPRRSPT